MLTIQFKWILVATTLTIFFPAPLVADEKDNFLENVKKSDNRVKSIIDKHRISYSMLTNANPLSPKQGMVLKQCVASWQGDKLSMHVVCSYEKPPAYSPSEQRIDYNPDGTLIIWRPVERYIQYSPTRNEVLQKSKRFDVSPDGSIKEANESTSHLIYPIGNTETIVEYSHFELAAGRGISKQLENIASMERDSSGKNVKIKAKGLVGKGLEGWWILSVDPNYDYLVREAEFSTDDVNSPPVFKVTSFGTVSTKDGVTFASKGSLLFDVGLETSVDNVEIVKMSDNDCNDFHQKISKQLDMPMTPGTQVWDFRGKTPVSSMIK